MPRLQSELRRGSGNLMTKRDIEDLGYFRGDKLFGSVRPIGQLALPDEEMFLRNIGLIYERGGTVDNGPLVEELEGKLADLHQTAYCVAYANASLAIIALVAIVADGRRGEVVMPAFTYAGLPHLVQWAGQMPCFCDIDRITHTLDPSAIAAAINDRTTAILAVHQVNSPCMIDELQTIATKRHLPLIFDSVHGIGCSFQGRPIGGFGLAEIFSLHATKLLNGFEGGYVTTNDGALALELRRKRNFGGINCEEPVTLGFNAKLNEVHAALALAGIDNLDEIIARNRLRYDAYRREFANIPGLRWIPYPSSEEQMNYEFALLEVPPSWPLTRDQVVELLRGENALARAYYSPPLHRSVHCPGSLIPPRLPVTEELSQMIIQMPVGELLGIEDIGQLAAWFRFIYSRGPAIETRLREAMSTK